jgi:hypothetical protein
VELKKGETILTDASLHLPAACLRKAFSDRSGVPLNHFELYYLGKRLEGEAALASWGVEKNATIEVKMRGRGGVRSVGGGSEALGEATTAPLRTAVVVTLHGGFDLKSAQASIAHRPTRPAQISFSNSSALTLP